MTPRTSRRRNIDWTSALPIELRTHGERPSGLEPETRSLDSEVTHIYASVSASGSENQVTQASFIAKEVSRVYASEPVRMEGFEPPTFCTQNRHSSPG